MVESASIADRVLERTAPLRLGPPPIVRGALALVAGTQLVLAGPWLVGTDPLGSLGAAEVSHMTRDGAFGVAIALAGLIAAWRHRHAIAAAIVATALVAAQFVTGVIDGHADRIAYWAETSHVLLPIILLLIFLCARPERSFGPDDRRAGSISIDGEDPAEVSQRLRLVSPAADD